MEDKSNKKPKSNIVDFMDKKATLRDRMNKAIAHNIKKTGVLHNLKSGLDKLDSKRLRQVEGDPLAAIKRIEDGSRVIRHLIDDMDGLKSTGWPDFFGEERVGIDLARQGHRPW